MSETADALRHQRGLLAEALGKVLVSYGVIRKDAALTGPELLLAAETAVETHSSPDNSMYYYNLFMQAKAENDDLKQQISKLDGEWRGGCAMNGCCRISFLVNQKDGQCNDV